MQAAGESKGAQFDPLATKSDATSLEEYVHKPLRSFLSSWIQSQFSFQATLRENQVSASNSTQDAASTAVATGSGAPETLNFPQTSVLNVRLPGQEDYSFLVSWQTKTPARCTMISISKAKIDETINRLEIAVSTPTLLPCSNPIMAVHSWAQDVFWKAPEQSQTMVQATIRKEDSLIPRGMVSSR